MSSCYHLTKSILFADGELRIELVELHTGEPDGYVGLPLTITDNSKKLIVNFTQVGHFKTECETYSLLSRDAARVNSVTYEEKDSEYIRRHSESALFAISRETEHVNIKHYVVWSENYVTHVLAADKPTTSEI